jgi:hypothetical protein
LAGARIVLVTCVSESEYDLSRIGKYGYDLSLDSASVWEAVLDHES